MCGKKAQSVVKNWRKKTLVKKINSWLCKCVWVSERESVCVFDMNYKDASRRQFMLRPF
jgi:hypothetical protein